MLSSVGARSSHPNLLIILFGGFPRLTPAMGRSAPLTTVMRSAVSSPSQEMVIKVCWTGMVSSP